MAISITENQTLVITRTQIGNIYVVLARGSFVERELAAQGDNLEEWWEFPRHTVPTKPGLYRWHGSVHIDDGKGYMEPGDADIWWDGAIGLTEAVGID
jgi:hypothetical protein